MYFKVEFPVECFVACWAGVDVGLPVQRAAAAEAAVLTASILLHQLITALRLLLHSQLPLILKTTYCRVLEV